ncbi:DUF6059 family protein [Streptomyces sp. NPDC057302]|uniref:DUF6059 family protein n=1 Tax=Streptomyces sp. NPDC057302 TaxID=3346094 RepID=UPI003639FB60
MADVKAALLLRRALDAVWQSLMAFGLIYTVGEMKRLEDLPHDAAQPLDAPPPGHPERLCPDIPLTAAEHALALELKSG